MPTTNNTKYRIATKTLKSQDKYYRGEKSVDNGPWEPLPIIGSAEGWTKIKREVDEAINDAKNDEVDTLVYQDV